MSRKAKIDEIMSILRGENEFIDSIPLELWAENPAEVARRLNAMARRLGFETNFTADKVNRFKEE